MIRKNLIRSLSILIVFSIVATFCIGFFDHNNVVASGTDYYSQFVSDSVTGYKNPAIGGLDQTGMVWTDKSVYIETEKSNGNFNVVLSALAQMSTELTTSEYPLDVVFVLDISGSMNAPVYGGKSNVFADLKMYQAIEALNSTIKNILSKDGNRVGVTLFGTSGGGKQGLFAEVNNNSGLCYYSEYGSSIKNFMPVSDGWKANSNGEYLKLYPSKTYADVTQPEAPYIIGVASNTKDSSLSFSYDDKATDETNLKKRHHVKGSTYTQLGLQYGYELLTEADRSENSGYKDNVPVLVLVTDGMPTIYTENSVPTAANVYKSNEVGEAEGAISAGDYNYNYTLQDDTDNVGFASLDSWITIDCGVYTIKTANTIASKLNSIENVGKQSRIFTINIMPEVGENGLTDMSGYRAYTSVVLNPTKENLEKNKDNTAQVWSGNSNVNCKNLYRALFEEVYDLHKDFDDYYSGNMSGYNGLPDEEFHMDGKVQGWWGPDFAMPGINTSYLGIANLKWQNATSTGTLAPNYSSFASDFTGSGTISSSKAFGNVFYYNHGAPSSNYADGQLNMGGINALDGKRFTGGYVFEADIQLQSQGVANGFLFNYGVEANHYDNGAGNVISVDNVGLQTYSQTVRGKETFAGASGIGVTVKNNGIVVYIPTNVSGNNDYISQRFELPTLADDKTITYSNSGVENQWISIKVIDDNNGNFYVFANGVLLCNVKYSGTKSISNITFDAEVNGVKRWAYNETYYRDIAICDDKGTILVSTNGGLVRSLYSGSNARACNKAISIVNRAGSCSIKNLNFAPYKKAYVFSEFTFGRNVTNPTYNAGSVGNDRPIETVTIPLNNSDANSKGVLEVSVRKKIKVSSASVYADLFKVRIYDFKDNSELKINLIDGTASCLCDGVTSGSVYIIANNRTKYENKTTYANADGKYPTYQIEVKIPTDWNGGLDNPGQLDRYVLSDTSVTKANIVDNFGYAEFNKNSSCGVKVYKLSNWLMERHLSIKGTASYVNSNNGTKSYESSNYDMFNCTVTTASNGKSSADYSYTKEYFALTQDDSSGTLGDMLMDAFNDILESLTTVYTPFYNSSTFKSDLKFVDVMGVDMVIKDRIYEITEQDINACAAIIGTDANAVKNILNGTTNVVLGPSIHYNNDSKSFTGLEWIVWQLLNGYMPAKIDGYYTNRVVEKDGSFSYKYFGPVKPAEDETRTYNLTEMSIVVSTDSSKRQVLTWTLPQEIVPTYKIEVKNGVVEKHFQILPVRLSYDVCYKYSNDILNNTQVNNKYYTNAFELTNNGNEAMTTVEFVAAPDNPYYTKDNQTNLEENIQAQNILKTGSTLIGAPYVTKASAVANNTLGALDVKFKLGNVGVLEINDCDLTIVKNVLDAAGKPIADESTHRLFVFKVVGRAFVGTNKEAVVYETDITISGLGGTYTLYNLPAFVGLNLNQPIVYTVTEIAQTGYEFVGVSDNYDWAETGNACTGDFVYSDNTVKREVTVTFTNKQSENDGYHSEGNIVNELGPDANQVADNT